MARIYQNPIIPGFYPDPSICRVGEDYFLVTSTFEYFPGLPIFHSRDLVNWRQIGHVLDRPSQLPLDGLKASHGLFAPTIRYHDGTFYVINTLVLNFESVRNFIVTATDPAGDWSEPYWLDDAPGIDPSLLFDEDGRCYYTGNRIPPEGEQFRGHREIWLQELDLHSMQLVGERVGLWAGALREGVHAEAPHLYKKDGTYYLMIAEGGTAHDHAVTIARSETITGPYVGHLRNPILTHRHLGLDYPIVGTGHADLVETQHGDWWMVLLAMRPYDGYFYNLGRETFLVPVRWEEGWPVVSPGNGRVECQHPAPNLPEQRWPQPPACDQFDAPQLADCWNLIRTPREKIYSLAERPSHLRLFLRPETLAEQANPSFVGRRQQHINFTAQTVLAFTPQQANECAGIALLQNDNFHFRFVLCQTDAGETAVRLIKRAAGEETTLAELPVNGDRFYFKVSAKGQAYNFYVATQPGEWQTVKEGVDGRILSTPVASGFTGAYLGMYASSNGTPSQTVADFDWFEYQGES
ncbi:MAG: glycoside hydrolase family 43 protein [Ardenticatenaceae bacterium]|nr:glycoside hydrolase family 43 protein [Ardenticatenaceae bacterium]MCB8950143.1 glycoside hydrolase family 43 protein [Ardenticatenaceae bacterium]